jgi:hypothetical protein
VRQIKADFHADPAIGDRRQEIVFEGNSHLRAVNVMPARSDNIGARCQEIVFEGNSKPVCMK